MRAARSSSHSSSAASLVDFGEVGRHGFGGVHRAHHDAGLACRAERNKHHRHLPNLFVQIVCLQEFSADVVELAERIEVFASGVLFHKLRVFIGHATNLVNDAVDGLEAVRKFGGELFAILPGETRSLNATVKSGLAKNTQPITTINIVYNI